MSEREPPSAKRVADLLDFEFPETSCYIEPKVLPKGSTFIFGGEAKIGKSWMMLEFARSLVTKRCPFDSRDLVVPNRARTLVIEQELGPQTFQERAKKVFEPIPRNIWEDFLFYESKRPELQLDSPEGRRYIKDMILDVRPNVLILDPISMMHGYNEDSAQDIAELFLTLEKFKKINPQDEMAVILSHHFKKPMIGPNGNVPPGFDRLSPYNFRGSSKWKDTPDTICTMFRGKDLDVPWEAWEVNCRWITRHAGSPPDMTLTVNSHDDGRVLFGHSKQKALRKLEEGPPKEVPLKSAADLAQTNFTFIPA